MMESKQRPELGQRCIIKAIAYKSYTTPSRVRDNGRGRKYPHTSEWGRNELEEGVEGYYIGWRVVSEGTTEWDVEYGEYGNVLSRYAIYRAKKYHKLWLFVTNERGGIHLVFPEDVMIDEQAVRDE